MNNLVLKRIMKSIRRKLLKFGPVRRAVSELYWKNVNKTYHENWAKIMHSGFTVHNLKPEKLEPYDTLGVVTDDGVLEEWQGGKVVGREYIDSRNWGGTKI